MNFLVIAGSIALVAFIFSYIRSGRFGVTVLALGVGYLLSLLWKDVLVEYELFTIPYFSWQEVVFAGLVLVPGIVALLFGPKQKSLIPKGVAALALAGLVVALLLPLLGANTTGDELYTMLSENRDLIISALLCLGLVDVILSRPHKAPKRSKD